MLNHLILFCILFCIIIYKFVFYTKKEGFVPCYCHHSERNNEYHRKLNEKNKAEREYNDFYNLLNRKTWVFGKEYFLDYKEVVQSLGEAIDKYNIAYNKYKGSLSRLLNEQKNNEDYIKQLNVINNKRQANKHEQNIVNHNYEILS